VILTRNNDLASAIRGGSTVKVPRIYELLLDAKALAPAVELRNLKDIENELLRVSLGSIPRQSASIDRELVRATVMDCIGSLPSLEVELHDWEDATFGLLVEAARALAPVTASVPALPFSKAPIAALQLRRGSARRATRGDCESTPCIAPRASQSMPSCWRLHRSESTGTPRRLRLGRRSSAILPAVSRRKIGLSTSPSLGRAFSCL
jgi:hypothetical protein